jgi:hypothetical protein
MAKDSWFLPFNKGYQDGAGNPPNPNGIKTDYLWKEILTKTGLTDIIENYAQIVEEKEDKGRKKYKQVFPRYHRLDVVRALLNAVKNDRVGKRYLIQHSAGSGKSNSIAWLAHQLIDLDHGGKVLFDFVIVVTDRRVLDKQIKDTIKQFAQVSATVGHCRPWRRKTIVFSRPASVGFRTKTSTRSVCHDFPSQGPQPTSIHRPLYAASGGEQAGFSGNPGRGCLCTYLDGLILL